MSVEEDIDEDEALARRLMQEDVDQVGTSNGGVRSPIAARNDILVGDVDYDTPLYRPPGRGGIDGIVIGR